MTTDLAPLPFPAEGSVRDQLLSLVHFGILAPSSHNTQPWLFRLTDDYLDVLADRRRGLPVVDPLDRELTISCGAAINHMEVAARHFGRELAIEPLPDRSERDLLARIKIGKPAAPGPPDRGLFDAIAKRRTNRGRYEDRPLPDGLPERFVSLAARYHIELVLIPERATRARVAGLVAEGDRIQFADPCFRRELAGWVHSRRSASQDGMSGAAFGMPDLLSPVGAMVIRTFDMGEGVAASDQKKMTDGSPLLGVFASATDSVDDWLATGRALSEVLLTITASAATASYLNQPVEVASLRTRLRDTVYCAGIPQLLLRIGYGQDVPPSVRRSVREVLV